MDHAAQPDAGAAPLSPGRTLLFLLVPWLFLALLAFVAWSFVLPVVRQGALHGYLLAALLLLVGASFAAAAVTLSRDLLAGRYP